MQISFNTSFKVDKRPDSSVVRRRQSAKMTIIMMAILVAVFALALGPFIIQDRGIRDGVDKHRQQTIGVVEQFSRGGKGSDRMSVMFQPLGSSPVRVEMNAPHHFVVGDHVEVFYDSQDPQKAYASGDHGGELLVMEMLLAFVTLGFLLVTMVAIRTAGSRRSI